MNTHRARILFNLLFLTVLAFASLSSNEALANPALEKAKTELLDSLRARGHEGLANQFADIDAAKLGTDLGDISAGNGIDVLLRRYEAKKAQILDDLYVEARIKVADRLGEKTVGWLEFAHEKRAIAQELAAKTYAGDFQGAGQSLWNTVRKDAETELKKRVAEASREVVKKAINAITENIIKDAGGWYLIALDLWISEVRAFEQNYVEWGTKFEYEENGQWKTRSLCDQYTQMRDLNYDKNGALNEIDPRKNGPTVSLHTMLTAGYQGQDGVPGYRTWRFNKSHRWKKNGRILTIQQIHDSLESCSVKAYRPQKVLQVKQQAALARAFTLTFEPIHDEIEREEEEIIKIIETFVDSVPKNFNLRIEVVDSEDNSPVSEAEVRWDGNVLKTDSDGAIEQEYALDVLSDTGRSLGLTVRKRGYQKAEPKISFVELKKRYEADGSPVLWQLSLIPFDKLEIKARLFDAETSTQISGVDTEIKTDLQALYKGTEGEILLEYRYRELELLLASSPSTKFNFSGKAEGYDDGEISLPLSVLLDTWQLVNDSPLEADIQLKQTPITEFQLKVTLIDADSGDPLNVEGYVKPDFQKRMPTASAKASFIYRVSELRNHAVTGMSNIAVNAKAPGYKQTKADSLLATDLLQLVDDRKSEFDLKINMESDPDTAITKLEVECEPSEIYQDQTAQCSAYTISASGKRNDVTKESDWLPDYVSKTPGQVRGNDVAKVNTLPHTVSAIATFQDLEDPSGSSWQAKDTVLVKPGNAADAVGLTVVKSADQDLVLPGTVINYRYEIANSGSIELSNVGYDDDKCAPVAAIGGDSDTDKILDIGETWQLECSVALKETTTNTLTVSAEFAPGESIQMSAQATVTVDENLCPKPELKVPNTVATAEASALSELKENEFIGNVVKREFRDDIPNGNVIRQHPIDGECLAPGTAVDLWVSKGEPPSEQSGPFSAQFECGDSFEIVQGGRPSKVCALTIRGWKYTDDRVYVETDYPTTNGLDVWPKKTEAWPPNMYNPGTASVESKERYIFSLHFSADEDATASTTSSVKIRVWQEGAGDITLNTDVVIIPEGQMPSRGPGKRPDAVIEQGTGGKFCVWRYKKFGDKPQCFHMLQAQCGTDRYTSNNNYELVGQNMTQSEGSKRMRELSHYFENAYSCDPFDRNESETVVSCPVDTHETVAGKCLEKCDAHEERIEGQCAAQCVAPEIRNEAGNCSCPNPEHTIVDGQCVPDCDSDQKLEGGQCVDRCLLPEVFKPASDSCSCPEKNHSLLGGECKLHCTDDEEEFNGSCVASCAFDEERVDGSCSSRCAIDEEWTGERCASLCANDEQWLDGMCKARCKVDEIWSEGSCTSRCAAGEEWFRGSCTLKCRGVEKRSAAGFCECPSTHSRKAGRCELVQQCESGDPACFNFDEESALAGEQPAPSAAQLDGATAAGRASGLPTGQEEGAGDGSFAGLGNTSIDLSSPSDQASKGDSYEADDGSPQLGFAPLGHTEPSTRAPRDGLG
ncbi:MAG: PASTA domain-containing protein, partial [Pseudomonadales bacterium]